MFFLSLIIIVLPFSFHFDILISNINPCLSDCDGSLQKPFPSIYKAFYEVSKNFHISQIQDEFHFKIVASNTPYFIKDEELIENSPFEQFYG